MLPEILDFIANFFNNHKDITGAVLDVGSRNVSQLRNIGTVKDRIPSSLQYIGLDMVGGENVDLVMNAYDIKRGIKPEIFDVVMCTEVLEHIAKPWVIVENMKWVLKPKGWLLISVPSLNHGKHEWPGDYYRFFEGALREGFFDDMDHIYTETLLFPLVGGTQEKPDCILGYAQKRP